MKFWKILGNCLDWLGANLGRIKTIGIMVLVIFFALSLGKNGCQRHQIEGMVERITGLNVRNDILHEDIKKRDSTIIAKENRIREIQDSLKQLEAESRRLSSNYKRLQTKYEALADSLLKISTDSSYSFLIHEAYPFKGEMKFPFNEPQVRGIHLTYLQKTELLGLNANLTSQVNTFQAQLALKDTMIVETSKVMSMMKSNRKDLEKVATNQTSIIDEKDKQINKERNGKTFWKVTTGILSIVAIVLAL